MGLQEGIKQGLGYKRQLLDAVVARQNRVGVELCDDRTGRDREADVMLRSQPVRQCGLRVTKEIDS